MKKLKFYKKESRWYIDYPEWDGPVEDLEMVAGADRLLDCLGDSEVTISVSTETLMGIGWDMLAFREMDAGGARYTVYADVMNGESIWLCHVTKFVFGEFPSVIWFRVSDETLEDQEELQSERTYSSKDMIDLLDWVTRKDSPYAIMYGDEYRFATNDKDFTIEEVIKTWKIERKRNENI